MFDYSSLRGGLRLRCAQKRLLTLFIRARYGDGGRQRKQLAGFSIIQSSNETGTPTW